MAISVTTGDALGVVEAAVSGKKSRKSRSGQSAQGGTVWIPEPHFADVRKRAERAGVTMSSIVRNLITLPSYATPSASQAVVLVKIADALRAGDIERARSIVRDEMGSLAKTHAAEVTDTSKSWERGDAR